MWYNPEIYTSAQDLTDTQILWAIYQHLVATTTLAFALVIFYFIFKLIVWFVPKFWHRSIE